MIECVKHDNLEEAKYYTLYFRVMLIRHLGICSTYLAEPLWTKQSYDRFH
jgi:hypothetical protein